jgi:hypothetical protein
LTVSTSGDGGLRSSGSHRLEDEVLRFLLKQQPIFPTQLLAQAPPTSRPSADGDRGGVGREDGSGASIWAEEVMGMGKERGVGDWCGQV